MHRKLDPAECGLWGFREGVRRADGIGAGLMQQKTALVFPNCTCPFLSLQHDFIFNPGLSICPSGYSGCFRAASRLLCHGFQSSRVKSRSLCCIPSGE